MFEYAPSAGTVVRSFEHAGKTESIVGRSGNIYPQLEDKHGHFMLGHSLEKADIEWLRDAWQSAQPEDPRRYPLVRVMPDSDAGFLTTLFEVLEETVVGSVKANRSHYEAAVAALEEADGGWLQRLVTRRVPLADFRDAFQRQDNDVKVVLEVRVP